MRRVLLVGGGHAHLHVVQAAAAWRDVEVVLASDHDHATYSGMVPGWVAGEYETEALTIDLRALCRRAGVRFTNATATRIDAAARAVDFADGTTVSYDLASFDIGSRVRGLSLPGVASRAIPARPVSALLERLAGPFPIPREASLGVVGGGAAGVELALALRVRSRARTPIHLVEAGPTLLAGRPARARRLVTRACRDRDVTVHLGHGVARADDDGLRLENGALVPAAAWLWVTGAAAPSLFGASGLAVDARGFLRVGPTLAAVETPALFAAGDCAALDHAPGTPRSGVHAVRAGPVLAHNLAARLAGRPLRTFTPQRHTLMLLNLGDGRALGTKWSLAAQGRWVHRVKDTIDRRFVERFRA